MHCFRFLEENKGEGGEKKRERRGGRRGGGKEEKRTPAGSVHCYFERTSFVHERRALIGSVPKSVYSDKLLLVRINGLIELDGEVLQRRFRKRVSSWISGTV